LKRYVDQNKTHHHELPTVLCMGSMANYYSQLLVRYKKLGWYTIRSDIFHDGDSISIYADNCRDSGRPLGKCRKAICSSSFPLRCMSHLLGKGGPPYHLLYSNAHRHVLLYVYVGIIQLHSV